MCMYCLDISFFLLEVIDLNLNQDCIDILLRVKINALSQCVPALNYNLSLF